MDLERLLPGSLPGFERLDAPIRQNPILALHERFLSGVSGRSRSVWLATGNGHPRVVEIAVTRFSTEDLAESFWARRPKVIKTLQAIDASLFSSFSDGVLVLQWSRGPVTFTEIARREAATILGVIAADDSPTDHKVLLNSLHDDMAPNVLPAARRTGIPLPARRIIRAAVLVGLFFVTVEVLRLMLPERAGDLATVVVLMLVVGVLFWPYIVARLALRRSFKQGDSDGVMRRALASRGISLP